MILGCEKVAGTFAKSQATLSLFCNKNGPQPEGPFLPIIPTTVSNESEKMPPFKVQR